MGHLPELLSSTSSLAFTSGRLLTAGPHHFPLIRTPHYGPAQGHAVQTSAQRQPHGMAPAPGGDARPAGAGLSFQRRSFEFRKTKA